MFVIVKAFTADRPSDEDSGEAIALFRWLKPAAEGEAPVVLRTKDSG
jgi:hypothetical protein